MKNKNCFVEPKGTANVQHSKLNAKSELQCVKCNGCMLSDNHDLCVIDFINFVNARVKSKSVKKRNACLLTRITTTAKVPFRKPTALESDTPKPVVTLVYSKKPKKSKTNVPVSKPKIINSISANIKEPSKSWGSIVFDVLSSSLDEWRLSKLFSKGVDLLTGSRGNNLYTMSLGDVMASYPICLLSKASKTKSWLWHRRLSHLNFGAMNYLASHGLVRGLPKLKFENDHLCSACAIGKSMKKPHKPKSEDINQEKLYLLHMDLCRLMCVASINGKKYILVIVDDYSQFTWTLHEYYEKVGISHKTSVARSLQQNGVVERRNHTLIEAGRTMLIYAKLRYSYGQKQLLPRIIEIIHVDFDELTVMASEHSSLGPALHEMTPATISSGFVPNPHPSTPFVPPSRTDWDILFQPLFDELFNPPPSVDHPTPEVIAPNAEVVAPKPAVSTGLPFSTIVE
ncbi:retrovirus-related pol polyprotein from transposon TNT 1-94 [Tanacetum coccineum]